MSLIGTFTPAGGATVDDHCNLRSCKPRATIVPNIAHQHKFWSWLHKVDKTLIILLSRFYYVALALVRLFRMFFRYR